MKQAYHLALTREDAKRLFACRDDRSLREFVEQLVTSDVVAHEQRRARCAPAWRALHACLSGGLAEPDGEEALLSQVFVGGRSLADSESLRVSLVRPDVVPILARALGAMTQEQLEQAFERSQRQPGEAADFDELSAALVAVRGFFAIAAEQRCAVVFAEVS